MRVHPIVLNNTRYYNNATTFVQRVFVCSNGDMEIVLYTTFEISRDVYEYLSISYVVLRGQQYRFTNGILYRPNEPIHLNQYQTVTSIRMETDILHVTHSELQIQFIWNNQLNVGEYILQPTFGVIAEYDEHGIEWAF
jgi:hypothetical protein